MESFDDATRVRGILPVVLLLHIQRFRELVMEGDFGGELVVASDAISTLESAYPEVYTSLRACESFVLKRAAAEPPFELILAEGNDDHWVNLVSYDQYGPAGIIVNDRNHAFAWAEDIYEQFSRDATPLSAK